MFTGKKCTFGKKCKYFHPECSRPVSERMKEKSEKRLKASSESIELAFELTHLSRTHNPSMPGNAYIRENAVRSITLTTLVCYKLIKY